MKLIPVSKRSRELLAALGRSGCAEICLCIMSRKAEEWKNFSDVYYALVSQTRMPWATYSKLTGYLVSQGFIEKSRRIVNNRKAYYVRLTPSGRELVKMYVGLIGKSLEELEPEELVKA